MCDEKVVSKDILSPATFLWEFVSNNNTTNIRLRDNLEIDKNWKKGTMLTIPSNILTDREIFPPNVPVTLRVSITFFEQEDATFLEELSLQFLPSPIEMKVQMGFSSIFDVEERLVIDLTDSYTSDGLVVEGEEGAGKWEWEWEWSCMAVVQKGDDTREEGEECQYESGAVVVMPGEREGRFEADEGERFQEGEAYYFSVKSRVREAGGGGEVVAEGRWSTVMSGVREEGVGLELVEDYWVCEDSSVGFLVILFFIVFFFFFFFLIFVYSCFKIDEGAFARRSN